MSVNDGLMSSETQEWETPQEFFERLDAEFGFTLDAAATDGNAKCDKYWTIRENALWQSWEGVVFCNPPYGRLIGRFVRKGYMEAQRGATVVMLIPSRTDTKYWHNYVMKAKEIRFVEGRLYFSVDGKRGAAPFPSAVIIFECGEHRPIISSIKSGSEKGA